MSLLFRRCLLLLFVVLLSLVFSCGKSVRPDVDPLGMDYEKRDYKIIDRHALAAPPEAEATVGALAHYLASGASNDEEKARAIFRWLTDRISYDTNGLMTGNYGDLSPSGVLLRRTAVCQGYAQLFSALATESGLKSILIQGYAKGFDYKPGQKISGTNHAWNAVQVDGVWRLVDATWGAGYLDESQKFKKELQDFYFFPPPGGLIYTHLPADDDWQLLDRTVKRNKFRRLALLKPGFFISGMKLKSHKKLKIKAKGTLAVELYVPDGVNIQGFLMRDGAYLDMSSVFVQRDGAVVTVNVSFPRRGEYMLGIFVADAKEVDASGVTTTSYSPALYYQVKASRKGRSGFPVAYSTPAGRTPAYLLSPLNGEFPDGKTMEFSLKVPGANRVYVQGSGISHDLVLNDGLYGGEVVSNGKPLSVCVDYDGGGTSSCLYGFNNGKSGGI